MARKPRRKPRPCLVCRKRTERESCYCLGCEPLEGGPEVLKDGQWVTGPGGVKRWRPDGEAA